MKYSIFYILFTLICVKSYAQENLETLEGKVTFVTTKNAYIRFKNTNFIKIGDTLTVSTTGRKCLLVTNKSSSSVVCSFINSCQVKKDDEVIHRYIIKKQTKKSTKKSIKKVIVSQKENEESVNNSPFQQNIFGRFSLATYNTFSDIRESNHRISSSFQLNIDNVNNSKLSLETFINYRGNLDAENNNGQNLRIFNLGFQYEATPTLKFSLGRRINPRANSLGAIDGFQVEKSFGNYYAAAIVGFRPDFTNFSFDANLLQYGGYFGHHTSSKNLYSETTLGLMEQRNNGAIDRRYIYLQHFSTIGKKVNLFSSAEVDIFNQPITNSTTTQNTRLTNLFTSIRYRFNRKINASISYDSRKRIILYETIPQTDIERLLDNDLARQGIIGRFNIRPTNNLSIGSSYGKRFQSDGQNNSDNINAFVSMFKVPKIGGRASLNFNMNASNYLTSSIASILYSKRFLRNKLNADFYYRFVNYQFQNELNPTTIQHYVGSNLFYNFTRSLTFSISGEYARTNVDNIFRIYTRIIKRF